MPLWFLHERDARNYRPQLMTLNQPLRHWNVTLDYCSLSLWLSRSLWLYNSRLFFFSGFHSLPPRPLWKRIKEKPSREFLFINNPLRSIFMSQLRRGSLCLCVVVAKTWLGFGAAEALQWELQWKFMAFWRGAMCSVDTSHYPQMGRLAPSREPALQTLPDEINTNRFIWGCHWFRA